MNEAMIGCESRDEYDILKREVGHKEKQIIELSMRGWKRKAIAEELGMSIEGVRVYEKRIVKRRYDCHKTPCDDRSLIEMHKTRNKTARKTYA